MNRRYVRFLGVGLAAGVVLGMLYVVYQMYLGGHPLLGSICLAATGLAVYLYSSRRSYTYRYLFPGLLGVAVFVVLPLAYTVWIGFTNYSSGNLLTFDRATQVLLDDVYQREGYRYQFTLHRDGEGFRLLFEAQTEDAAGEGDDAAAEEDGIAGGEDSIFGGDEDSIFGGGDSIFDEEGANEEPAGEAGDTEEGPGEDGIAGLAQDAPRPPAEPEVQVAPGTRFVSPVLSLDRPERITVDAVPLAEVPELELGEPLPLRELIARRAALSALKVRFPDESIGVMDTLRTFAPMSPVYERGPGGTLVDQRTGEVLTPNFDIGFYVTSGGEPVQPGFRVNVGFDNYLSIFTDPKFRGPFFNIFVWNVTFAGLTVLFTLSLGLVLSELLTWEGLRGRGVYRMLLFLPYAVPSFISILVFKGLFNSNFGEINLILEGLFGIRPLWFEDPFLAKVMILMVNTWLGYPYFMLLCMGLQKSIPRDLYEASALAGAGPLTNFFKITWPLIRKPLTPLLISSFAFNFNNFVLIFLLTGGRPDFIDTTVPAGETDILVSYTYRIAFEYAGQNFGLAAAISTLIFFLVALMSWLNLRLTKVNEAEKR